MKTKHRSLYRFCLFGHFVRLILCVLCSCFVLMMLCGCGTTFRRSASLKSFEKSTKRHASQHAVNVNRAAHWKKRGYDFDPSETSAAQMDVLASQWTADAWNERRKSILALREIGSRVDLGVSPIRANQSATKPVTEEIGRAPEQPPSPPIYKAEPANPTKIDVTPVPIMPFAKPLPSITE